MNRTQGNGTGSASGKGTSQRQLLLLCADFLFSISRSAALQSPWLIWGEIIEQTGWEAGDAGASVNLIESVCSQQNINLSGNSLRENSTQTLVQYGGSKLTYPDIIDGETLRTISAYPPFA